MVVNPNTKTINAAAQLNDVSSPFSYWQSVLALRKMFKDIVVYGDFEMLDETDEKVMAYIRRAGDESAMLVLCNFSAEQMAWAPNGRIGNIKEVLLGNGGKTSKDFRGEKVALAPYEACVALLE